MILWLQSVPVKLDSRPTHRTLLIRVQTPNHTRKEQAMVRGLYKRLCHDPGKRNLPSNLQLQKTDIYIVCTPTSIPALWPHRLMRRVHAFDPSSAKGRDCGTSLIDINAHDCMPVGLVSCYSLALAFSLWATESWFKVGWCAVDPNSKNRFTTAFLRQRWKGARKSGLECAIRLCLLRFSVQCFTLFSFLFRIIVVFSLCLFSCFVMFFLSFVWNPRTTWSHASPINQLLCFLYLSFVEFMSTMYE